MTQNLIHAHKFTILSFEFSDFNSCAPEKDLVLSLCKIIEFYFIACPFIHVHKICFNYKLKV